MAHHFLCSTVRWDRRRSWSFRWAWLALFWGLWMRATPGQASPAPEELIFEEASRSESAAMVRLRDGRMLKVSQRAQVKLGSATAELMLPDWNDRIARFASQEGESDLLLVLELETPVRRNGEQGFELGRILFARFALPSGALLWRRLHPNLSGDPKWNLLVTPQTLITRELAAVTAIERSTGKRAWSFSADPLESTLNPLQILTMAIESETVRLRGRYTHRSALGYLTFERELDLRSGQRVYRKLAYDKPIVEPLYVRPAFRLEYPGDIAPPEVPKDWEGLRLYRTRLLWNRKTGDGIIINPLHNDAKAIIELARAQQYKSPSGPLRKVRWVQVLDLPSINRSSTVPERSAVLALLPPSAAEQALIHIEEACPLAHTGEWVDAEQVAKALGAQVIRERSAALPGSGHGAGQPGGDGLLFYRLGAMDRWQRRMFAPDDRQRILIVQWGPYTFFDENRKEYPSDPF